MKISEFIRRLEQLKREQGDIEICREDGKPFTTISIDKVHPIKNAWMLSHTEPV